MSLDRLQSADFNNIEYPADSIHSFDHTVWIYYATGSMYFSDTFHNILSILTSIFNS